MVRLRLWPECSVSPLPGKGDSRIDLSFHVEPTFASAWAADGQRFQTYTVMGPKAIPSPGAPGNFTCYLGEAKTILVAGL